MNTGSTDQKDLFTVSDATLFFFWGGGEGGKGANTTKITVNEWGKWRNTWKILVLK